MKNTIIIFSILLSYLQLSSSNSHQLLSFKSSVLNQNVLQNWNLNNNPCNFTGVQCKNSVISSIDLSFVDLRGGLLSNLLSNPNLETLILRKTNLSGEISVLECSSSLRAVDLAENEISGDVSMFSMCLGLKSLNLSGNTMRFGYDIQLELQLLDVSYNKIVGEGLMKLLTKSCKVLEYLSLRGNKIGGSVGSLRGCGSLEYLDLGGNNFTSVFPDLGECGFLRHLDLSANKFSGEIGDGLSNCGRLSFVNLTRNLFSGGIPRISSGEMEYLHLSHNDFGGVMGSDLLDLCPSLVELNVSANNLSGMVPEWLGSCASLEVLDISKNNFSGEFPIDVLLNLNSLKTVVLAFNEFVGVLPDSLSKMGSLEYLDLSSNELSGSIPVGLCENPRTKLEVLYLQNNRLTGPIPASLSNCSEMVSLDLSFNYLTGVIPVSFGRLSKLRDLMLWLNELHGEIPKELMYLQSLENLILDFNDLTGFIPDSLSNCTNLNWISLSNNRLSGEIPASFGRLSNLAILKLGNNSFSGMIPSELGDCQSLLWLDLNTNSLSGNIPPGLFKQSGNIADALLTGKQYGYIKNDGSKQCHGAGNLLEFGGIREEQNRISSRNPCNSTRVYRGITQPTFNHNGSMIFLDLSYNKLEGSIPKELGSMYYLMILNLGHNDLMGPIPPELGGLKNVAILDLSHNQLNGSIPPSLNGLTYLGEVDISNNLLFGKIPESAPFDTFPASTFLNNSGLCGYPLAPCGGTLGPSSNRPRQKSHLKQASLAGSVAMGLLFSLFCVFGLIIIMIETKKRRKKKEEALEAYIDGCNSNSGTVNSAWKLTSARDALSITIAAFDKPLRRLTFADLLKATNDFHYDNLIGSGGFGEVYRAKLKDDSVVAIKKLVQVSGQGDREFTAEMETIGKVKHRNLVPLLGYCKVGDERLLVYEYMKFGSLEDVLHNRREKKGPKLNWSARRKIALGAARGLAFLHSCMPHIVHRDMKSSNVLLDENLEARVSDFGMARHMNAMDTHISVTTLAGTPGYVPPEYYQTFRCSTRGDVYSYGVVLLELLTGKEPTNSPDFGENNLVGWVKNHVKTRISDVLDRELLKEDPGSENELLQHLKVAYICLDDRPNKRPTMIQVMAMFKEIQAGSGFDSLSTIGDASFGAVQGIEMQIKEVH